MHAFGQGTTGGSGGVSQNFAIPFVNTPCIVACLNANALNMTIRVSAGTTTGFNVGTADTNNNVRPSAFYWHASGF